MFSVALGSTHTGKSKPGPMGDEKDKYSYEYRYVLYHVQVVHPTTRCTEYVATWRSIAARALCCVSTDTLDNTP